VQKGRYQAMDALAQAVREKRPTTGCNEIDGARATAMVRAAAESLRRRRPVPFDLARSLRGGTPRP
jgi:hypothetical protein